MTETNENDETTTWTDERDRAHLRGEKRPIPEQTLKEAQRRREGQ